MSKVLIFPTIQRHPPRALDAVETFITKHFINRNVERGDEAIYMHDPLTPELNIPSIVTFSM
jgi:hypothetical protein